MPIKNLMENIVTSTVARVLDNDKSLKIKKGNRDDIIAFVLNRVQPRYVTSERGILHGKMDTKFMIQEQVDILMLVYEAIGEIITRRKSEAADYYENGGISLHLPHIIGEVLEESTYSVIDSVEVTMLFNGKEAEMVDTDWKNPYLTNRATQGYFHFWPRYLEKEMGKKSKVAYTIRFSNDQCQEKTLDIELKAEKKSDMGKSHVLPVVLLTLKEGIDPDSLYES